MIRKYKKRLAIACLAWGALIQPAFAEQVITPEIHTTASTVTITPVYSITAPQDGTETGLGLRLHFNSSELQFSQVSNIYSPFSIGVTPVQNDINNDDGDATTDKVINAGWLDINAQWPGTSNLPVNLYRARFTPLVNLPSHPNVNFTASSQAVSSTFRVEDFVPVEASCDTPELSISIDENLLREGSTPLEVTFSITEALPVECGDLSLYYHLSGTADRNDDYSFEPQSVIIVNGETEAKLIITGIDDNQEEDDESIVITLANSNDYTIDSNNSLVGITLRSAEKEMPATEPMTIPTLSEWMMILLSLSLFIVALLNARRNKE